MDDYWVMLTDFLKSLFVYPWFKAICAGTCSCIIWLVGDEIRNTLIPSLFLLMFLDYALGFIRGWQTHRISSGKMKRGLLKFILYGIAIIVSVHVNQAVATLVPYFKGINLRPFLIAYLIINEGLSVLEHLTFFGVPLPSKIVKRLRAYRDCIMNTDDLLPDPRDKQPVEVKHD